MTAPAIGAATPTLTFLAVRHGPLEVGFSADEVRGVVTAASWTGEPPVQLPFALRPAGAPGELAATRLLLIDGGVEATPGAVEVQARLSVRTVARSHLQPVPEPLARFVPLFRAVVLPEADEPALLVIEPLVLFLGDGLVDAGGEEGRVEGGEMAGDEGAA